MKVLAQVLYTYVLLFTFSCQSDKKEEPTGIKVVSRDSTIAAPEQLAVNNFAAVDISPMDMSYFPADYPKLKMTDGNMAPPIARVVYSRPHLQQRRLFASILKYDEPWRLGANESTEIDFYKPVIIQEKKINAGRYILYSIPHKESWTIILNSNIDTWGLKQDSTMDIQHFEIPVTDNNPLLEYFTLVFEKNDTGANLVIAWDDIVAKLPFSFK